MQQRCFAFVVNEYMCQYYYATDKPKKSRRSVLIDETWLNKSKLHYQRAFERATKFAEFLGTQTSPSIPTVTEVDTDSDSDSDCAPAENARKRWIADTGSGHDLICEKYLTGNYQVLNTKKIKFNTAGGDTDSSDCVELSIDKLGETVQPIILDNTPPVLSVGKRVMEQGYSFPWPNGSRPYFVHPVTGKKIKLKVNGNIPYLIEDKHKSVDDSSDCVPSAASSKSKPKKAQAKATSSKSSPSLDAETSSTSSKSKKDEQLERYTITGDTIEKLSDGTKNQIKIAQSLSHLMTHYPKNPHCEACARSKMRSTPRSPSSDPT